MNSLWLVITALAAFSVAYRYYAAFLATKVAMLDDSRPTPAHRLRDGVDYHPTNRNVLFGHHFAAIAGPGPLIGPVLAAQWGYFPGFAWIVIGACLAGGAHDFVTLWASVREDGLTLPQLARRSVSKLSGATVSIATLFIIVCTLASVGKVVVNALSHSPWGMFTILVTIPAALLTGLWMYKIRPGHIAEASAIGVTIVLIGVFAGKPFADSAMASSLTFSKEQLSVMLPVYATIASILPVWVLMCPRDYLSSYMKIGVIAVLAVGIFAAHPTLQMPAVTYFTNGTGPVVAGKLWPFLCIVIMCGAISGFHSLISSGTTPKMVYRETDMKAIGYGSMVLEGFVSITALVAACSLQPGDYFAINYDFGTDKQAIVRQAAYDKMVDTARTEHNWDLTPKELPELEAGTKETLKGRVGGAVTLAVGMARVFDRAMPWLTGLMSYWYHFVIMFEALFILTLLETGTRVARFVFQETIEQFRRGEKQHGKPNWFMNVVMSIVTCFCWGYLLYTGNLDSLWRMLGIANQLLASTALVVGTTYLLLHAPRRSHALITFIPLCFLFVTTVTASVMSISMWWAKISPQMPVAEVRNTKLLCGIASIMLVLVLVVVVDAVRRWIEILRTPRETPAAA